MSHNLKVKIRFKRSLSNRIKLTNSSTPMSISCSPSSSTLALALQKSSCGTSLQESVCQELIRKNVDKLGRLAEKCERLNSNLDKVVVESHKILDNSFLASQAHLTEHVTHLNNNACVDIKMAIDIYSEYMQAVEEIAEAEEIIYNDLAGRLERMNEEAQSLFLKVS